MVKNESKVCQKCRNKKWFHNCYSRLGWVEFLQIPLKHSVSRAFYFLSSEWCILLKSVANRTATKQSTFYLKNEFCDISQLLSKLRKYSFGSTLIIFGLELLRLSFFKIPLGRAPKRPILAQFSEALWQFCAQPISIICTILDSGGKGLSIKNVSAKSKKLTHPTKGTFGSQKIALEESSLNYQTFFLF